MLYCHNASPQRQTSFKFSDWQQDPAEGGGDKHRSLSVDDKGTQVSFDKGTEFSVDKGTQVQTSQFNVRVIAVEGSGRVWFRKHRNTRFVDVA
jgi:hypothetical protein